VRNLAGSERKKTGTEVGDDSKRLDLASTELDAPIIAHIDGLPVLVVEKEGNPAVHIPIMKRLAGVRVPDSQLDESPYVFVHGEFTSSNAPIELIVRKRERHLILLCHMGSGKESTPFNEGVLGATVTKIDPEVKKICKK
jgi:hypothetical protein